MKVINEQLNRKQNYYYKRKVVSQVMKEESLFCFWNLFIFDRKQETKNKGEFTQIVALSEVCFPLLICGSPNIDQHKFK